jgi:hypothetical protein
MANTTIFLGSTNVFTTLGTTHICLYNYLISVSVQPEDAQHQWPKHVVVLNGINTFILPRNIVVLDIYTHTTHCYLDSTTGMTHLKIKKYDFHLSFMKSIITWNY